MRLLILADLHHDFWADDAQAFARLQAGFEAVGPVDRIILAGDVANKARVRWRQAAHTLRTLAPAHHTYVFPGNHDYYQHRIDGEDRLQSWAEDLGWQWAQEHIIDLGAVRFISATLWTDMELHAPARTNGATLAHKMNDYRAIRVEAGGYRKLRPEDTTRIHRRHLAFFDHALAQPFDGHTAIVSHHAPHPSVLTSPNPTYDAAYASDLTALLERHHTPTTRRWFFGHAHHAQARTVAGWDLRPHSLGYPDEGRDPVTHLPTLVVDTNTW